MKVHLKTSTSQLDTDCDRQGALPTSDRSPGINPMVHSQSAVERPPTSLKWAYSLVVLGAVIPIGVSSSSWVMMARGGGLGSSIPFVGPIIFLVLGLYRTYQVARIPGTLTLLPVRGFALTLRRAGVLCLYCGAVVSALNFVSFPLNWALSIQRIGSGVGFLVGLYLSILGGIGVFGLLAFELSRLIGFENRAGRDVHSPS